MQSDVRRAAAFAAVASLSLAAPVVGAITAVPFALIGVLARMISGGPLFELFADRRDQAKRELRGLVGFVLAATGLSLVATLTAMPVGAFVSALLLVSYGNLVERLLCDAGDATIRRVASFGIGGGTGALLGQASVFVLSETTLVPVTAVFLAITGTLMAALLRVVLAARDDPVVIVATALILWLLAALEVAVEPTWLLVATAVAGAFGYLSWLLGIASISGMLTGIVIGLLTIVLGGIGWFVVIIAFFGIGGLASKYRYEDKREQGVAEENEGARGGRNVLGNASVALVAVVAFAGGEQLAIDPTLFLYAFIGSISTAMSDTISGEIGVLYGPPRLVTTFKRVEPGTDGGVTLEGALAGVAGAAGVAILSWLLLGIGATGVLVVIGAGFVGMIVDSLLGATVEGRFLGNQAVNLLATLSGAVVAALAAVQAGLAVL